MVEVEEADGSRLPAVPCVHSQGHPIGKVLVDGLVAGHAGGVDVLQLKNGPLRLPLCHPLIQPQQRSLEPPLKQDRPFIAPLRRQHFPGRIGPPQPLQELSGGLLGVVVFAESGGCGHFVL